MDIIEYAKKMTVGQKLVGVESEPNDYPLYRRNVLVFEDGTRVTIYLEFDEYGDQTTRMKVSPGYRGAVVEDGMLW